jgi:hypothetical protein
VGGIVVVVWIEAGTEKKSLHSFPCLRTFCVWKSFLGKKMVEEFPFVSSGSRQNQR